MIKLLFKKIIPSRYLPAARRVLARFTIKNRPVSYRYHGDDESVLQSCIAYNIHGGYCVPQSSIQRPAAQKILTGQVWEPDTIEFMCSSSKDGDIVHAGTYFGDFIPAIAKSRINGACVWAFEPNPENFRCASITIKLNDLQNVSIQNAGLGDKASEMSMKVADQKGVSLGGASQLVDSSDVQQGKVVVVNIVTIDDIVPSDRNVAIIQLDVEGFERQALTGAMQTIERTKPVLILENLPEQQWLEDNILKQGYRIAGRLHDNTYLVPEN